MQSKETRVVTYTCRYSSGHLIPGYRFEWSSSKILIMMVGLTIGCEVIFLQTLLATMFSQHILAH